MLPVVFVVYFVVVSCVVWRSLVLVVSLFCITVV